MSSTSQVLRFKVLLLPENVFKRFSMNVDDCTFDKLKQVISSNAANATITSIKYEDTEGDWIMLSSQTELDEAVRMNLFKKDENEVIRLQVQLSAPVVAPKPSVSPVVQQQPMLYPNPQPQLLPSPPVAQPQPQPANVVVVPRRNVFDVVSDAIGEVFSIFTGPTPTTTTSAQCKPVQNQQPQQSAQQNQAAGRSSVHAGVMCDGCRASPIVGTRWQCCVCPASFDLCTECFNNKRTVLHPANHYFREISAPNAAARVSSVPQPQPQPIPPQQIQPPVVQPQFQPVAVQQQQPNLQLVQQQQPLPTYQQELDILATMGFTNRELCLDLLRKHGGSIPVVVELYLQQAPQQRTQ